MLFNHKDEINQSIGKLEQEYQTYSEKVQTYLQKGVLVEMHRVKIEQEIQLLGEDVNRDKDDQYQLHRLKAIKLI